jgi:hypothetical protein
MEIITGLSGEAPNSPSGNFEHPNSYANMYLEYLLPAYRLGEGSAYEYIIIIIIVL